MTTNDKKYMRQYQAFKRDPINNPDPRILKRVKISLQGINDSLQGNLETKYLRRINFFLTHTTDDWRGFYKIMTGYTTRRKPEEILLELIYDFISLRKYLLAKDLGKL